MESLVSAGSSLKLALKLESTRGYRRTNRSRQHCLELSKEIRIKLRNFSERLITEFTQAGMLERLSHKRQPAIFQLYPKPFPGQTQTEPIREEWVNGKLQKTDDAYWYSNNLQYRCPLEDYMKIERLQRDGTWKRVSEYHRAQVMPKSIVSDFERYVVLHHQIQRAMQRQD